jgi:hypothetical protein
MSVSKIRWLTAGMLASAGAGMLSLTAVMNSAFAFGDTITPDITAVTPDIGLVMGGTGLPQPGAGYVEAADGLYLNNLLHPVYPNIALSELLGAGATYFNSDVPITPIDYSSLTDIVNGLTHVVSTDVSTALPLFDTVLALGVSLPNYDISLFGQGLEAGNLLAALGDPIAADIGILPLPVGLDLAVLGEALATTGYELIGGLIP